MHQRRRLLALVAALPVLPVLAQPKVARIGILSARARSTASNPDSVFEAFLQGMRALGYVEGKNLVIEWRAADGKYERFPALAAELVALKPDVLVSHTTPGTRALQQATRTIPIVMTSVSGPVEGGFAASLARPGGNITGMALTTTELSPKQLELLQLLVRPLTRIAVLTNPDTSYHVASLKGIEAAAQSRGIQVVSVQARNSEEVALGFERMVRERVNAAIVVTDGFFSAHRKRTAELARKFRIPTMHPFREDVEVGGLISYGPTVKETFRRAATHVDKILKGAKPADLPIEQPLIFELLINRRAAKELGLTIPKELVARADEVIE